jgi:ABC-type multidrug transport system, ATPase component
MTEEALIRVEGLYRYYGEICAVRDVSFTLRRGEVLGFLGPNGAGKTSTMRMLSGNLAPSAGRVCINGFDLLDQPKRAKANLGYLPEHPPLYRDLTVDEYLSYCARLHGIARSAVRAAVEGARARCGLERAGRRLIANLSKGFQQRLGIAQAILHSPMVVILDEPTIGLDPIQIREVRNLIRELGREHGVILSTHILPEVQTTCNRVQIIHEGQLVFSDSTEGLRKRLASRSLVIAMRNPPSRTELGLLPGVEEIEELHDGRLRLHHPPENSPAERLVKCSVAEGWGLYELVPERASLEQIFVELTCSETHIPEPLGEETQAPA